MEPTTALILGGAALGGQLLGGYLQGSAQENSTRAQIRAQQQALARQEAILNQAYSELSPYYQNILNQLPVDEQIQALKEWNPTTMESYGRFDPNADVQAWLDPSAQYQQQMAMQGLQSGQAAAGTMRSGAAMKELQDRAQNMAMADWQNARSASYADYTNRFNAAREANAATRQNALTMLDIGQRAQAGLQDLSLARAGMHANTAGQMGMLSGQAAAAGYMPQMQAGQAIQSTLTPQNVGAFYQLMNPAAPTAAANPASLDLALQPNVFGGGSTFNPNASFGASSPYVGATNFTLGGS